MARGKKTPKIVLLMKKIEDINSKIEDKKAVIASLEKQKAQLENELKEAKLEELSSFLDSKGMTIEEVKVMVENSALKK